MIFSKWQLTNRGPASKFRPQGKQTRQTILTHALKIAACEGLTALTIGRLAKELQMSKSGLFAHFKSKQSLELATVEQAKEVFAVAVLQPTQASSPGVERLWNLCDLCDLWLLHIERGVFSGSYFFTGAFFQYACRSDPVAKAIMNTAEEWFDTLRKTVEEAQERGEIRRDVRAKQLVLELNCRLVGAHWTFLLGDGNSFRQARAALLAKLREVATDAIPVAALESSRTWRECKRHPGTVLTKGSIRYAA
jgi:AcrR family transcriptional regulator